MAQCRVPCPCVVCRVPCVVCLVPCALRRVPFVFKKETIFNYKYPYFYKLEFKKWIHGKEK